MTAIPGSIEAELSALLADAISFDQNDRMPARKDALEYVRGVMEDTPSQAGRSSMTTSDVADAVSWIMPGLMRIFSGAAGVVQYEPLEEEDEDAAEEATELVQALFEGECEGYKVLWQWFYDALVTRNGIVKYWWEPDEKAKRYTYQAEDELTPVLYKELNPQQIIENVQKDEETGVITFTAKKVLRSGRFRVECVPPEEFLINRDARSIEEAMIVGHRCYMRRHELVAMGYDKETVDSLPAANVAMNNDTTMARTGYNRQDATSVVSRNADVVEYFEGFIRFDLNGDGKAELLRVCSSGSHTAPILLDDPEEWDEREGPNFADLTPEIVPHSWQGRSIADDARDIQRAKTVLLRQSLDNLYLTNRPQRAVDSTRIENPNEVMNPRIGGVIRVKGNPREAIQDLAVPFTGEASLAALTYFDNMLQRRTGVSQQSMNLDGDALVPQTATAAQKEHDASYSKIELIARNFAETGVKKLFKGLLLLLIKHQNTPMSVKVKKDWKTYDPQQWSPDMSVRVNVGLGTGTRERDVMMLRAIGMEQDKVIAQFGPDNPVVTVPMWVNTRQKMVAASGLKDADRYFADVSEEDLAAWMQSRQQAPDPKMVAVQQKAAADMYKTTGMLQLKNKEIEGKLALKEKEMATEAQLSALDIAIQGNATEGDTNIKGMQ